MEVREIDDPTELGMKWNAEVKLVFKIINSPDGKVSVQVVDAPPSCDFQAQLQVIDEELARFDQQDEDKDAESAALPSGVGARVVDSTLFLKNLFTPTRSSKQASVKQKVSWVVQQPSLLPRKMESILSKRMRQDSNKDKEEDSCRRKRRTSKTFIQMMEADDQPRQQP